MGTCMPMMYIVHVSSLLSNYGTHLSPGVSFIYDLVHDSGILQSELFTSRSQNLVLAKLPNSGFWRYGQFFKWNRVKMAKNGLKMVEIFWGASHMIDNNIFNIFCFSNFDVFGCKHIQYIQINLDQTGLDSRTGFQIQMPDSRSRRNRTCKILTNLRINYEKFTKTI